MLSARNGRFLERAPLAPSLAFKLAPATTLLLQAEHLSDRRVTDFGIPSYHGRAENGWFNQTELTQKAWLAGMAHQFLYGVEFGKQHKDQVNRSQNGIATVSRLGVAADVLADVACRSVLDVLTEPAQHEIYPYLRSRIRSADS